MYVALAAEKKRSVILVKVTFQEKALRQQIKEEGAYGIRTSRRGCYGTIALAP